MNRTLIAGCGDLGCELGRQLAADGCSVHGLRRRAERIPAPIAPVAADLARPGTLGELPARLDGVIYLATPGSYDDAAYRTAYVDGLRNLLGALPEGGHSLQRLVFVSSTSVYGVTDGSRVDEETATEPGSFSGRRLLEAEALVHSLPNGLVVRFGGIYGPGRERMLRKVRQREPVVANPPQWTNRIHRDDCIGVLRHLLRLPDATPVYLGVDHYPCPMHEVTDWLADRMGLPRPPHVAGRAGGTRGSNKRCANDRLLASGYSFRYPTFREGYAAMLAKA